MKFVKGILFVVIILILAFVVGYVVHTVGHI